MIERDPESNLKLIGTPQALSAGDAAVLSNCGFMTGAYEPLTVGAEGEVCVRHLTQGLGVVELVFGLAALSRWLEAR